MDVESKRDEKDENGRSCMKIQFIFASNLSCTCKQYGLSFAASSLRGPKIAAWKMRNMWRYVCVEC